MILITGTVEVEAVDRKAFLEVAERQITLSRQEAGCIDYACGEDTLQPCRFTFVERWRDQAAVDEHFAQDYCREFIAAVAGLATNDLAIELLHADRVEQRQIPRAR